MRKYLLSLVVVILVAGIANAGMNLRQNRDGTASWLNTHRQVYAVGAVYLPVLISDLSTASTSFVTSPITDAYIEDVQLVLYGNLNVADVEIRITVMEGNPALTGVAVAATILQIAVANPTTPSILQPATFTIYQPDAVTGAMFSISPIIMQQTTDFSRTPAHENNATPVFIEKDTVIGVSTDGGSTNNVSGLVIITLRPRG